MCCLSIPFYPAFNLVQCQWAHKHEKHARCGYCYCCLCVLYSTECDGVSNIILSSSRHHISFLFFVLVFVFFCFEFLPFCINIVSSRNNNNNKYAIIMETVQCSMFTISYKIYEYYYYHVRSFVPYVCIGYFETEWSRRSCDGSLHGDCCCYDTQWLCEFY